MSDVSRKLDAAAKPEHRRRKRKKRKRARERQLKLEDLAGPQLDVGGLSRRLGAELDDEHLGNVRTVVECLFLEDIDEAEETERGRARFLRACLGGLGAYGVFVGLLVLLPRVAPSVAVVMAPLYDAATAIDGLGLVLALSLVLALIRWLRATYANTELFALDQPRFSVAEITWGFFIPWLNLYRPYQALVRLHRCSDPEQLPDVPEVVEEDQVASYRRAAASRRFVAASAADLRFPIGAFWAAYVTAQLVGRWTRHDAGLAPLVITTVALALSGFLGLAVVDAIATRRTELMRRMRRILVEHAALER